MSVRAYLPELLLSGGRVQAGAALIVRNGAVVSVGSLPPDVEQVPLRRAAILPGLVSAHSHAFQRAIRGRTERRTHPVDDFWTWREAMYAAAEALTPDEVEIVSRMCFREMARAGVTCVGEFHFLHRDPEGHAYADPNELSRRVIKAARDVGLRIALLRVAYARAGYQIPPNPRQRRFIEDSPDVFLQNLDALSAEARSDALVSVGAAPHSVRACPKEWISSIAVEAARRGWPFHMHIAEQAAEVTQCRAEHSVTPLQLLAQIGALTERLTAVHGIQLTPEDIALLGQARATVCACPTTERNLGDGVVRVDRLFDAGAWLAVGTDSQCQINPLEDVRALELHLRLVDGKRAVLGVNGDGPDDLALRLLSIASEGGMRSLSRPGGSLLPGEPADFIVVDLDDPSIAGASQKDLAANVVFALERTAIRKVFAGGNEIVLEDPETTAQFRNVMQRLWGQS